MFAAVCYGSRLWDCGRLLQACDMWHGIYPLLRYASAGTHCVLYRINSTDFKQQGPFPFDRDFVPC